MNTPYTHTHSLGTVNNTRTTFDNFQEKVCTIYPEARKDIGGFLLKKMSKHPEGTPEYEELVALYVEYSTLATNNIRAITALANCRNNTAGVLNK